MDRFLIKSKRIPKKFQPNKDKVPKETITCGTSTKIQSDSDSTIKSVSAGSSKQATIESLSVSTYLLL